MGGLFDTQAGRRMAFKRDRQKKMSPNGCLRVVESRIQVISGHFLTLRTLLRTKIPE
jgi:hypothetical protein